MANNELKNTIICIAHKYEIKLCQRQCYNLNIVKYIFIAYFEWIM